MRPLRLGGCEEFGEFGSVSGKNSSGLGLGGGEPRKGSEQSGRWAKSRERCEAEGGPITGLQGELGGSCLCHAHKPASYFRPRGTCSYSKG